MAHALFDRIRMVLEADAHGIVESLEERSLVLKQCLREAELEVNRKRARLDAVRDEEERLTETARRREDEIRALDEDVTLALQSGKDDLARFAIKRLLPRRAEVKALAARIGECAAEGRTLGARVEEQQQRLEAMRTRVRAELARETTSDGAPPWSEAAVADEEVELELMRRRDAARGAS